MKGGQLATNNATEREVKDWKLATNNWERGEDLATNNEMRRTSVKMCKNVEKTYLDPLDFFYLIMLNRNSSRMAEGKSVTQFP